MIHSSSETTSNSPTPISPFSTYSRISEATSDEAPDLGAFNTVFRELQQLQIGPPRILHPNATTTAPHDFDPSERSAELQLQLEHELELDHESTSPRSALLSALPTDSEANAGSTVWNQVMVASYLDSSVTGTRTGTGTGTGGSVSTMSAVDDRSRATDSATDYDQDLEHDHNLDDTSESETEGEGDPVARTFTIGSLTSDAGMGDPGSIIDDPEHPTLGTIDSVIEFLIAERDRVQAGRLAERRMVQHYSSTSDGGVRQSLEADMRRARKRRRKRVPKTIQILRREVDPPETVSETTVHGGDVSGDADRDDTGVPEAEGDSSSSLENTTTTTNHAHSHYKSTPSTPPRTTRIPLKRDRDVLKHSKSTPTLKVKTIPPDPQILKLRCLAHKLRLRFPEDYERITALLTQDFSGGESDFSDPRGPAPRPRDTLIHVFIDHSNILIGLLTYHKKHRSLARRPKRLSHAALALLLERGRPITRRCLVTSSPLYQPMESAIQLGYDVRIYARVPDNGDGADRVGRHGHGHGHSHQHTHTHTHQHQHQSHGQSQQLEVGSRKEGWRKEGTNGSSTSGFGKAHGRGQSAGNTSTDSDRASRPPIAGSSGTTTTTTTAAATNATTTATTTHSPHSTTTTTTRIRYREQGVDELLQLKLHQALANTDPPPPNATIVLATGDGNVGQFNEEGFLGPVRLALQRGWRVELYAWEEGLSRAWRRAFEGWEGFRIVRMEDFAEDLLEVDEGGR